MKKSLVSISAMAFIVLSAIFTLNLFGTTDAVHDGSVKSEQAETVHAGLHAEPGGHHAPHIDAKQLSLLWIIPFVGILLSIALFPLVKPHFWHHHYGKVSLFWGVLFFIAFSVYFGLSTGIFYMLEVYMLEFIPFITLLLALFTVAGGIQLKGQLAGTPKVNTFMILIGGALASFMGTTGAAMVMIRPILKANEWRRNRVHIVVFVIFVVANIGGGLTPLGDPPLFLGFLKGVDFFWTAVHMLPAVIFCIAALLVIFFFLDSYYYKKEENQPVKNPDGEKLGIAGIPNIILLPCVTLAVLASSMKLGDAFTLHYVTVPWASILQVSLLVLITIVSMKITD